MATWKNKLSAFVILLILLPHESIQEGDDDTLPACPPDVLDESDEAPQCPPLNTYVIVTDGVACRVTLDSTDPNCPDEEMMEWRTNSGSESDLKARGGWLNSQLGTDDHECNRDGGPIVIDEAPSQVSNCHSYRVPVCEDGKHELNIWTVGGTDATRRSHCYDIQINGEVATKAIYLNFLSSKPCPRTEVKIKLKVDQSQTKLVVSKTQIIPIQNGEFSLGLCFSECGNKSGTLQVASVVMTKSAVGGVPAQPCNVAGSGAPPPPPPTTPPLSPPTAPPPPLSPPTAPPPPSQATSDCKHYNGYIPSKCWGHGCQYHLRSDKGPTCVSGKMSCEAKSYLKCICSHSYCEEVTAAAAADCKPEPPIFNGKLSCRRAKSYYIYHPKQHCYNEKDSGDCTATVTHAVNSNGMALTDNRGISYINDIYSGFRDPHGTRFPVLICLKIEGVRDHWTKKLYATAIVGKPYLKNMDGKCLSYPVPICQRGEYMLTIKMTEDWIDRENVKCTEVRLNSVPIMLHLDPWTLAGNMKCGPVDAVLMFIAEGGDDNDLKSDRVLYLKGHDEPILVAGGRMELEVCYGYDCCHDPSNAGCPSSSILHPKTAKVPTNTYQMSGFSLERLGDGTRQCKLK